MFSAPARSGTFVAIKVLLQIQSSGTLLPHTQQVHRSQSLVTCDGRASWRHYSALNLRNEPAAPLGCDGGRAFHNGGLAGSDALRPSPTANASNTDANARPLKCVSYCCLVSAAVQALHTPCTSIVNFSSRKPEGSLTRSFTGASESKSKSVMDRQRVQTR